MLRNIKNVVISLRVVTLFVLLRPFGNIIYDLALKYNSRLKVKDLRKLEKLQVNVNRARLDVNF